MKPSPSGEVFWGARLQVDRRRAGLRWLARALAVCAVWCAFDAAPALAKSVYVNTRYAKLRAGKTSADAEVAKLAYGQELTVVGEASGFWQVRTADGKSGWIARLWTADSLPSQSKVAESLGAAARGGSSGVAYTAGARGLAPEAEQYATEKGDYGAAVGAVKEMEKFEIGEAKLEAFLREGKLGEFAEFKAASFRPGSGAAICAEQGRPVCVLRGIR